jgi:hypothetical protein
MASLPADEDYARSVLAIFGLRNVRARESLPLSEVQAAFLDQNMGRRADFEAAIEYAVSQAWLAPGAERIRLTAAGAEEMHTVSWPLRGVHPMRRGEWPRHRPQ